jgi:dienelactone hydrolase
MSAAVFQIEPQPALIDRRLHIRVVGLAPRGSVTIHASQADDGGQRWVSQATFIADDSGMVDVTTDAPISGSYSGVDGMGLIWSMMPEQGKRALSSQIKPIPLTLRAEVNGQVVAEAEVTRLRVAPDVTVTPVRERGLVANLFAPAAPGHYPAMIVVSGSGGGLSDNRAALFASYGIAALSLAYFNFESLPKGLIEIPLEYFETAIHWLQAQPNIDPERLGITGASRGGELSLLLGATFPQFKAVVAIVPSGLLWNGFGGDDPAERAAWTYRGQSLSYVPSASTPEVDALVRTAVQHGAPIPLTPGFHACIDACESLDTAVIPVEQTHGAILMISGEDDQMWPSTRMADVAVERLKQCGFPHPYEHLRYPNAGHAILPPHIPTTISYLTHPVDNNLYALGGTAREQAFANEDSWVKTLEFLRRYL